MVASGSQPAEVAHDGIVAVDQQSRHLVHLITHERVPLPAVGTWEIVVEDGIGCLVDTTDDQPAILVDDALQHKMLKAEDGFHAANLTSQHTHTHQIKLVSSTAGNMCESKT